MNSIVTRSRIRQRAPRMALTSAMAVLVCLPAMADDLDVYRSQVAKQQKPNILFVLDYSGSMAWDVNGNEVFTSGQPRRIDILREAVVQTMDENRNNANFGIGSIYSAVASGVRWPVSDLNVDAHQIDPAIPEGQLTARDAIEKLLYRVDAEGATSTVNALVESAMYFKGGRVAHGDRDPAYSWNTQPDVWNTATSSYGGGNRNAALPSSYLPRDAFTRNVPWEGQLGVCYDYSSFGGLNNCQWVDVITSSCVTTQAEGTFKDFTRCDYRHNDRWTGAFYVSPIDQQCQVNAMVLISDGEPTMIDDNASLKEVAGTSLSGCKDLSTNLFLNAADTTKEGNCGPEIVRSMANSRQNPAIPESIVNTYTVGFSVKGAGQDYLKLLATEGKGRFIATNSETSLKDALAELIAEINGGSQNFSELNIDVNRATFSHDNRAYFNLFSPSSNDSWKGNVKGYFIDSDGLKDVNGRNAIISDNAGTRFTADAQSFWSLQPDGNKSNEGGASARLIADNRNLYTYLDGAIPSAGIDLSASTRHRLIADNSTITDTHLGLDNDSAGRAEAINWLQDASVGDPLHSQSVNVNYGSKSVVYAMTNQGLLHAFDATQPTDMDGNVLGGEELFAFMPQRLLANLPKLANNSHTGNHIYGLDGALTRWHEDENNDGIVNGNDSLMLVFGMRRGGSAYYALDVTIPSAPRLMWTLDNTTPGFEQLAQSWSRAALVRVKRGGSSERVLAFGGGYDAAELDDQDARKASKGNALYMVDRQGKLIWSASNVAATTVVADMKYAIASDLTIIDSDGDRNADRLYVGDLGGQVWRVDFDDVDSGTGFSVARLADLDNGSPQRFFYPPSVAQTGAGNRAHLSVSMGSGDRTDPMNATSRNALFMLRDEDIDKGAPTTPRSLVHVRDLYDATTNNIDSADGQAATEAKAALDAARGWMIRLDEGEKALARLVTFENRLMVTTFRESVSDDSCGIAVNGRIYSMDVATARPLGFEDSTADGADQNSSNTISRYRTIRTRGIPSSPLILFPQGTSKVQVVVDKQTVDVFDQRLATIFWHSR